MATTVQNIRDFYGTIGKTITNAQFLRLQAALATQRYGLGPDGEPREPDASDYTDWLWRQSATFINRVTEQEAKAAVVIPAEDLLD